MYTLLPIILAIFAKEGVYDLISEEGVIKFDEISQTLSNNVSFLGIPALNLYDRRWNTGDERPIIGPYELSGLVLVQEMEDAGIENEYIKDYNFVGYTGSKAHLIPNVGISGIGIGIHRNFYYEIITTETISQTLTWSIPRSLIILFIEKSFYLSISNAPTIYPTATEVKKYLNRMDSNTLNYPILHMVGEKENVDSSSLWWEDVKTRVDLDEVHIFCYAEEVDQCGFEAQVDSTTPADEETTTSSSQVDFTEETEANDNDEETTSSITEDSTFLDRNEEKTTSPTDTTDKTDSETFTEPSDEKTTSPPDVEEGDKPSIEIPDIPSIELPFETGDHLFNIDPVEPTPCEIHHHHHHEHHHYIHNTLFCRDHSE